LSRLNRGIPPAPDSEVSSDKQAQSQPVPDDNIDSLESGNVDSLREVYLSGRSEGKMLMSEANFNHVLQNNFTPGEYPGLFQDVKGFVRSNFALTSDQNQTLDSLSDNEAQKVRDAGNLAAKLNKPLAFEFQDPDPSAPGPRILKLSDPVVLPDAVKIV